MPLGIVIGPDTAFSAAGLDLPIVQPNQHGGQKLVRPLA